MNKRAIWNNIMLLDIALPSKQLRMRTGTGHTMLVGRSFTFLNVVDGVKIKLLEF